MDFEQIQKNKLPIILSLVLVFILGMVFVAQADKNPNNNLKAIFQKKITIPTGAQISASLNTTISSENSNIGDIVVATVSSPLTLGNDLLIPQGSTLHGMISYLEKAIKEGQAKSGAIALSFNKVELPNGQKYDISGSIPLQRAEVATESVTTVVGRTRKEKFASGTKDTVIGAATGAALGTAIGAIAGGGRGAGRGAWSGAAVGGGLGAAKGVYSGINDRGKVVTTTKTIGQDVTLKSGEGISVTLEKPMQVAPQNLG